VIRLVSAWPNLYYGEPTAGNEKSISLILDGELRWPTKSQNHDFTELLSIKIVENAVNFQAKGHLRLFSLPKCRATNRVSNLSQLPMSLHSLHLHPRISHRDRKVLLLVTVLDCYPQIRCQNKQLYP
jgi:hypothetical protein